MDDKMVRKQGTREKLQEYFFFWWSQTKLIQQATFLVVLVYRNMTLSSSKIQERQIHASKILQSWKCQNKNSEKRKFKSKKKKLKILGKAFVYLSHLFTQKKGGAFIRGKECLTLFTMIDSFSG